MKTLTDLKLGQFRLPMLDYAIAANAVLGIKESGKSYAATCIAEQLMLAGVPIIAFDPIGVWHNLKVAGPGGQGFKVVVVGGKAADLPLTPQTAPEIVRAAIRENVSLVIDLFDMTLSKADWRRIVESCVTVLLHENKSIRHIFIEEAAEFVPQAVGADNGRVYAVCEKLIRMGGNAQLGVTLINPRAQELNKAVLELCESLLLFRQKGRRAIEAIEKWLEQAESDTEGKVVSSLSTMPTGTCWVWPPMSKVPTLVQMQRKLSLHPDRRRLGAATDRGAAEDVTGFVTALKSSLKQAAEELSANDPAKLRAELASLRKQLASAAKTQPPTVVVAGLEQLDKLAAEMERVRKLFADANDQLRSLVTAHIAEVRAAAKKPAIIIARNQPTVSSAPLRPTASAVSGGKPQGGQRRMMVALAQRWPLTRRQLGLRAGLSSGGGTFASYLSHLKTQQWIQENAGQLSLTDAGVAALGPYEPLPEGRELLQYWMAEVGGGASRMLAALAEVYPQTMTRAELGEATSIASSGGTFASYLSRLRTLELVTGSAELKLSEELT